MKVHIFYFSGTGNTSWVSRELVSLFLAAGSDASAHSIEKTTSSRADMLIEESDIIGFGYPIYGSDLPHNMKEFLLALSPVSSKPAFVFCTQWKWSGDGSRAGSLFINEKGFKTLWAEHFLMPNNVCAPILPFPYTNDQHKIEPVLRRAEKKAGRFVRTIISGKSFLRGFNPLSAAAGSIQRNPFRRVFHKLRDDVGINTQNCTNCLLCVNICPSANFFHDSGKIKTNGSCLLCLRCYNFCPVSAITYKNIVHNKKRGVPYKGPGGRWDESPNASWPGNSAILPDSNF